jgi:N-methylhydantoinase A
MICGSIGWAPRLRPLELRHRPATAAAARSRPMLCLLAGVLNPNYFAGGRLRLDRGRAALAMENVAVGLKSEAAAVGVHRVVEANMINALKLVSIQRGHDPRDFVLIAAGGGGPMHAASLGRELGVKIVITPYPGYFSAWGMPVTEPRRDFVQTV